VSTQSAGQNKMINCGPINTEMLFNETEDYGDHASVSMQNKLTTTNIQQVLRCLHHRQLSYFNQGITQREITERMLMGIPKQRTL
jgi:hypothetical protein